MFVLRSQFTYHRKYIMNQNYSLPTAYIEIPQVEMFLKVSNFKLRKIKFSNSL